MAKAIKAALIAVVVVVIVIYGGAYLLQAFNQGAVALGATAGGGAAGALAASVMTAAAVAFVGTLVSAGIGAMNSKGGSANVGNYGTKTSSRQAIAARQLVYGQCRVGGVITHMETTGTDNTKLCMIVVIAGHPIDSLVSVRLGDKTLSTGSSTVSGETVRTSNDGEFTNTENPNSFGSGRLVRFTFHDGTQTARDGLAAATLGNTSIPTTHKYINCAYVYVEMIFDSEALPSIPPMNFLVKGKNVYDPRTGAVGTSDLQRNNPALQIRDFLTDTVYGLKAEAGEINDTTNAGGFASAANTCDQNATLANGSSTETRYQSSGFSNFSASGESIITGIQSAMAGKLTYTNGKFNVFAGAAQTPSMTITDDDLLAAVAVDTGSGGARGDLYNQVKSIFVNSADEYKAAETPTVSNSSMLSQDTPSGTSSANYKKTLEVQLPFTTTETMAQRIAQIQLKYQRKTLLVNVNVATQFIRLQPSDFVYLTNERLGFSQKLFEVQTVGMALTPSEGEAFIASVNLGLREIADDVWNFASNEYSTAVGQGSVINTGSFAKAAPTIGTLVQRSQIQGPHTITDIIVPWTNVATDAVQGTEVQYKLSGESDFIVATVAGKGQTKAVIQNVAVGSVYNVRLRHFSFDNVYSGVSSQANITIAQSDTIAAPSSVSATTDKPFFIELKWTNAANTNLRAVEVHASATSGFTPSTGTLVNSYYGDVGKAKRVLLGKSSAFGFNYGTNYYFRLRSINVFGTATAYTSQVTGKFVKAGDSDVENLNAARITAGQIDADTITLINLNAANIKASGTMTGVNLKIGSNNSVFKANASGIQLGHDTFGSAPFRVTPAGALTASSVAITGGSIAGPTVGGFTTASDKMFLGTGTFNNNNTGFYVDTSGNFSLKSNLNFNGSTLTVNGNINASAFQMTGGAKLAPSDINLLSSQFEQNSNGFLALKDDGVPVTALATSLQSNNYSAGSAGWKIQRSGDAEFNGVVVSRNLVVATGTINVADATAGQGGVPARSDDVAVLKTIYEHGVYSAGFSAWAGATSTFMVNVSMQGAFDSLNSTVGTCFFGAYAEMLPLTRFTGTQGFTLKVELIGRNVTGWGAPNNIVLTYKIYKVT